MMLYLVNQEAADFLSMLEKKNLLFPIPQVQKSFPPFDPVEKVLGKIRQTISLK